MPKQDPKSSKRVADNVFNAHFDNYNPSEQVDERSSSNNQSSSPGDSYDPNQTINNQTRTTKKKKEKNFDPTGHEGSYNPSDSK